VRCTWTSRDEIQSTDAIDLLLVGTGWGLKGNFDYTYPPRLSAFQVLGWRRLYAWNCFRVHFFGFAILVGGEINFLLGELRNQSAPQSSISARTQIHHLNAAA
jgi:hypothetical protein